MRTLYAHQSVAVASAVSRGASLIVRPLGSGKTAIALHIAAAAIAKDDSPVLLVGPAHLLPQYEQEMTSWPLTFAFRVIRANMPDRLTPATCYAVSYDRLRMHSNYFVTQRWSLVIVDEFHHAKDPNTLNHRTLISLRAASRRFVGMTGAPFQNHPHEFFHLVSLVAGKPLNARLDECLEYRRPNDHSWLRRAFMRLLKVRCNRGPIVGVKRPDRLRLFIAPFVDFHADSDYADECGLPVVNEGLHTVTMTPTEVASYARALGRFRRKKDRLFFGDLLDDHLIEGAANRMSLLRQMLLGTPSHPSSKAFAVAEETRAAFRLGDRILVFCNFVTNGIQPISRALELLGVPYARFTGSTNEGERGRLMCDFLEGRTRVLVLSPVGFEGLDLRGATRVLIADPHFNPERTAQMVARATRAETRGIEVRVSHFVSQSPDIPQGTIDEIIMKIAERKRKVNAMVAAAAGGQFVPRGGP